MNLQWAKVARDGGKRRGCFHAWKPGGKPVCAHVRKGHQSKAVRQKQPWKACLECLRLLGLKAVHHA